MPNKTATTAFSATQRIAAAMRTVQAKEDALNESLEKAVDLSSRAVIENEIIRLCACWNRLYQEYTKAFSEYTAAVEASRLP